MFFIDELEDLKLYKKKFLYPIVDKSKKNGSLVFLLAPNSQSAFNIMNHKLFMNKYFYSYYLEKGVMYYIQRENGVPSLRNDGELLITEAYKDIIKKDGKIIYKGFQDDIDEVSKVLNSGSIIKFAKTFGIKPSFPITINIYKKSAPPSHTATEINVSSRFDYGGKIYKNYNAYLMYEMIDALLSNYMTFNNPHIVHALALYESGLYELHKSKWIFDSRLKLLCSKLRQYEDKYGRKKFLESIKDEKVFSVFIFEGTSDDLWEDPIQEVTIENGYKSPIDIGTIVGKKNSMRIDENYVLIFNEDAAYNTSLRNTLYKDRIKSNKDLMKIYDKVKENNPFIKYAYYDIERYKGLNLFYDASYYLEVFMRTSSYKGKKASNIFLELMKRIITDQRIPEDYKKKTVVIPIKDWNNNPDGRIYDFTKCTNPFTAIYNFLYNGNNANGFKEVFKDTTFLFLGENAYFKVDFDKEDFDKQKLARMLRNLEKLKGNEDVETEDNDLPDFSTKAITTDIVDKVEKSQGVTIDDISGESDKKDGKTEIVKKVKQAATISNSVDDTLETLDTDENLKKLLTDIANDSDNGPKISAARAARNIQLNKDLMDKEIKGRKISDILSEDRPKELEEVELKIESVNDEWKHLQYPSSMDKYDPTEDIIEVFQKFSNTSHPLAIRNISVENTSTSEDKKETYTVEYENENGKRFSLKVDVPLLIDNKYMKLRGNVKNINGQITLIPIIKTDEDTVQVISYSFGRKIFIRRFGTSGGKSNVACCKLTKALSKNEFKNISVIEGDCTKICSKYEVPFDYIDLAGMYSKIVTPKVTFFFNQDELREKYEVDDKKGLPFAVNSKGDIIYYNTPDLSFSRFLALQLELCDDEFTSAYNSATQSVRYTYSQASILGNRLPLILVCAYNEGLQKVLRKANIEFEIIPKDAGRPKYDVDYEDVIKFNDGWIKYKLTYSSSLLMNGLKACATDTHSLNEIDSKPMYLDFFDSFGGRIMADGIDNFYDLMIDPITEDTLKAYKLPTDYIEVLLYANSLLADNKYVKHSNISEGRRIRRNELIPGYLYSALSRAYEEYTRTLKHGRAKPMSIKQSAAIDNILVDNTVSDLSILTPLNEYEAINTISPKGLSGLNTERAYTLDKRVFDDSMVNVFSLSTGFAANVGINRQATIDMNIVGKRGYVKSEKEAIKEYSPTKTFCMTEALTPFGCTRDDPFRSAMTFIQTSKHLMRTKKGTPPLITSGADEALPYLVSNTFAYKAKSKGEVLEKTDDYMIISYEDGSSDYVNLAETVEKNSSSGFYVNLKLDSDLKVGSKVKEGQIVAYDKASFNNDIGPTKDLSFANGTLKKCAIINTNEGYEDSAIISKELADDLSNPVVLKIEKVFSKDTNVYNMVEKGQNIDEGDSLLIIQQPFDDADTNTLLKNLTDVSGEDITDLGRIKIKSKVTGMVQEIIMYRTVELDELSESLRKLFTKYEKEINIKKKKLESYGIDTSDLPATYKLEPTGKLKDAQDGVKIEFYLRYEDKMSVGDKLVFYSALKGVVQSTFPTDKEPTSEFRPDEKIHSLLSVGSVNARMVTSIFQTGAINKFLIELTRKCKDIAGIKYNINDI